MVHPFDTCITRSIGGEAAALGARSRARAGPSHASPFRICIVGASGKLGRYMVAHALERGYEVVGVCREQSVGKLADFADRITIVPGDTNDPEVIRRAVAGCDGVLTVLAPWGVRQYASGTAQAVLDHAPAHARLVFSCGWHITRDGKDVYSPLFLGMVKLFGAVARLVRTSEKRTLDLAERSQGRSTSAFRPPHAQPTNSPGSGWPSSDVGYASLGSPYG